MPRPRCNRCVYPGTTCPGQTEDDWPYALCNHAYERGNEDALESVTVVPAPPPPGTASTSGTVDPGSDPTGDGFVIDPDGPTGLC